jgi:GTP-binding protein
VFQISALTREGCEPLIQAIMAHVRSIQKAAAAPEYIDPRFVQVEPSAAEPAVDVTDPRFAPREE